MNNITLNAYLFFRGECREAMEFYQSIFGGELTLQTYREVPGENPEGMTDDMVMHAGLSGGDVVLMASDTSGASAKAAKVVLSLGGDDKAKLTDIFNKLGEGVEIQYPLKKEFWGDIFGSLTDKYGIEWMVNIEGKKE